MVNIIELVTTPELAAALEPGRYVYLVATGLVSPFSDMHAANMAIGGGRDVDGRYGNELTPPYSAVFLSAADAQRLGEFLVWRIVSASITSPTMLNPVAVKLILERDANGQ